MKTSTIIWTIVGILIVALAWYWLTTRTAAKESGSEARNAALHVLGEAEPVPVVKVMTTAGIGPHLVASNGMTLYRTAKDSRNKSNCTGACVLVWPPYVLTSGSQALVAGEGVTGTVATMQRRDGSTQVTYEGAPLYFWKKDLKPGEARGEGLGKWSIVRP